MLCLRPQEFLEEGQGTFAGMHQNPMNLVRFHHVSAVETHHWCVFFELAEPGIFAAIRAFEWKGCVQSWETLVSKVEWWIALLCSSYFCMVCHKIVWHTTRCTVSHDILETSTNMWGVSYVILCHTDYSRPPKGLQLAAWDASHCGSVAGDGTLWASWMTDGETYRNLFKQILQSTQSKQLANLITFQLTVHKEASDWIWTNI